MAICKSACPRAHDYMFGQRSHLSRWNQAKTPKAFHKMSWFSTAFPEGPLKRARMAQNMTKLSALTSVAMPKCHLCPLTPEGHPSSVSASQILRFAQFVWESAVKELNLPMGWLSSPAKSRLPPPDWSGCLAPGEVVSKSAPQLTP